MPDRESLLDARGRKATPLLLFNSVIQSLHSPRGYPDGEGSVERSHADRAQGLISWMDSAEQPEAHRRRIEKACVMLAAGKRRP